MATFPEPLALVSAYLRDLPPTIRNGVTGDPEFEKRFGLSRPIFNLGERAIARDALVERLRALVDSNEALPLKDVRGQVLDVTLEIAPDGSAIVVIGTSRFVFEGVRVLQAEQTARISAFEDLSQKYTFSKKDFLDWISQVGAAPLTPSQYAALIALFEQSIEGQLRRVSRAIEGNTSIDVSKLLPSSIQPLTALLPLPVSGANWSDYARCLQERRREILEQRGILKGALVVGPTFLLPDNEFVQWLSAMNRPTTLQTLTALMEADDPFSIALSLDVCARQFGSDPELVGVGTQALRKLLIIDEPAQRMARDFSISALTSIGPFSERHMFGNSPHFFSRFAYFSWAGYLTRALSQFEFDRAEFAEEVQDAFTSRTTFAATLERRSAPYWQPEYLSFDGIAGLMQRRGMMSFQHLSDEETPQQWKDLVTQAGHMRRASGKTYLSLVASPLEEFSREDSPLSSPVEELETQLKEMQGDVSAASFLSFASNLVQIAEVTPELTELLRGRAIEMQAALEFEDNADDCMIACQTLSYLAGIRRDKDLAKLAVSCARAITEATNGRTAIAELFIVFDAASAFSDIADYLDFISQRLGSLALGTIDGLSSSKALRIIESLCDVEPRLRQPSARAKAAFRIVERLADGTAKP